MKPSQIITTDLIADLMSDDLEGTGELQRSMFITTIKKVIEKEAEVYAEPDGGNTPDRSTRCVVIVEKVWEVMNAFIHQVDSLMGGSTDADDEPTISKAVAINDATGEKFLLSQSAINEFKKALKGK